MQTITLDTTSTALNEAALASALETYAADYFDSITDTNGVVTCSKNGADIVKFDYSQSSSRLHVVFGGYDFQSNGDYNVVTLMYVFDGAIALYISNAFFTADNYRLVLITKDKSGQTAVIVYNSYGAVDGSAGTFPVLSYTASGASSYTIYRGNSSENKAFAFPVWTGDSYTENVLTTSVAAFSGNFAPHKEYINGTLCWGVANDAFLIPD